MIVDSVIPGFTTAVLLAAALNKGVPLVVISYIGVVRTVITTESARVL